MNLRTITLSEAVKATGISRASLLKMIHDGTIAANRHGKVYRVSVASLEAWVMKTAAPVVVSPVKAFPEVVEDRFA